MAKKSSKDILAKLRAEKAKPADDSAPAESTPAEPKSAPASGGSSGKKSSADILAKLRAEKAGGGGAEEKKPAAKPAEKAKAQDKEKAASAAGDKPSVEEMVKAVRQGQPVTSEGKQGATAPAKAPKKPVSAGKKKAAQQSPSRRSILLTLILSPFALAWLLCGVASGAFLLAMARFMMPNTLVEPPSKFKIGGTGDFPFGRVDAKFKAEFGVWIVHTEYKGKNSIYALLTVCTHLGCTPNWLEGEQKFKCPCHGSGFRISGIHFEGPAPRPLERVGIQLGADGLLEVDKSKQFKEEMGEWNDPTSFVEIV